MIYSTIKAAWHTDMVEGLRLGKVVAPKQVQLILSDLCNQDCAFCAYRMSGGFSTEQFAEGDNKNPNRKIPTEKAEEIIKDCADLGVKAIQFTGGGEPTVHPRCWEMIAYAQSLGLKTGLVTNGVRIRDTDALENLDWIRVSVDAGMPHTYSRTRRTPEKNFFKVIENMKKIGELCQGVFGVGFVVTRENWPEIVQGALIAEQVGAQYIRYSAVFSDEGASYYTEIHDCIKAEIAKAKKNAKTEIFDLFGDRINDLELGRPDYSFCGYQHYNVYIGGNCKVYRCCTTSYTKHGEVGDLSNMSFRDWLKGSQDRHGFDARTCHHCQFNNQNKVINYLLDPSPLHVDFV